MPAIIHRNLANFAKLQELMKRKRVLQIGVFEGKNARQQAGAGNAKIGSYHEQLGGGGGSKLPRRSFLKDPVTKFGKEAVKVSMESLGRDLRNGRYIDPVRKVGVYLAEKCKQSFDQSGPGWAPLAASTVRAIARRGSRSRKRQAREGGLKPLLDTGQLQRSVGWRLEA